MDTKKTNNNDDLLERQKQLDEMREKYRAITDRKVICPTAPPNERNKRRYEDYGSIQSDRPCIRVNNRGANALLDDSDKPAPKPNGNKDEGE